MRNSSFVTAYFNQRTKKIQFRICGLLFLICIGSLSFGQTLNITDLRKSFDKPTDYDHLLIKGFTLIDDTVSTNIVKYSLSNLKTGEYIEQNYILSNEGAKYLSIVYRLPNKFTYDKFISTLTNYKFKYSKRDKCYQKPTSSYSGEIVFLKGMSIINGTKFYSIEYVSDIGKELSAPPIPIK